MNFDFLKDLINLAAPIKTCFVIKHLKYNVSFIVQDHDETGDTTLVDKLEILLHRFLEDELNEDALYDLLSYKLQLDRHQFHYLYNKLKQDVSIKSIVKKILFVLKDKNNLKSRMDTLVTEDDYIYTAEFLIRECNNAVKYTTNLH
uniref:PlxyGVORF92 protein n=1 Tax=Plutella xylostella granulovirus TaxID=98383 RepID=A0A1B2CSH7_9BBAC|nr:PlxyGVORF92 protein [Plutella xylostella granulovirus]